MIGPDEHGDISARPVPAETSTRRRHRWMTIAAVGVLVVTTAATWALAGKARTPRELAAAASAPPRSTVTVPVRFGTLVRTVGLECAAAPSTRVPVPAPVPPDNGEPIVTALPVRTGGQVTEGRVVMEVSGRPVIVLAGRLPSYRDILPGVSGPDVRQLQKALIRLGLLRQADPNGVFDARTRAAVVRLYRARGYPAPGPAAPDPQATTGQGSRNGGAQEPKTDGVTVPRRELLTVPQLPARLGTVKTRVGASVKAGDLLLEAGNPVLRCAVPDAGEVHGLAKGAQALVTSPSGTTVRGRVERITTSGQGGDGQGQAPQDAASPTAGQDGSPDGGEDAATEILVAPNRRIKAGEGYQARIGLERAEHSGPIVPSSALWSRAGGRTVVKIVRNGQRFEANVEPGLEVDGEVAVQAAEGTLRQGDQVVVSSEAGAP